MLGQRAVSEVLGIDEPVALDPREMADDLTIARFPDEKGSPSDREQAFADQLVDTFEELGVEVVDFESTLTPPPIGRALGWIKDGALQVLKDPTRLLSNGNGTYAEASTPGLSALTDIRWGSKVEPGTTVIAAGEGETGELPVDYMGDFRDVTIVNVLDKPDDVEEDMPFTDHYNRALELFTYHMTNVVVGVGADDWFIYNFNGSHPFYDREADLGHQVLHSLIPKLAAPIRPPRLSEFDVTEEGFDPQDDEHAPFAEDLVGSGPLLEESGLYPPGRDLDTLVWRNRFYRWAGAMHLDDRTGMSYGFLARQLPTDPPEAVPVDEARQGPGEVPEPGELVRGSEGLRATLDLPDENLVVDVPDVEVLTLASGCDKTDPHPREDLVKVGLSDGQLSMTTPEGVQLEEGYRPSFDTKVILAHAVGNALIAAALEHREGSDDFATDLADGGMALTHWHGYLNPDHVPDGWHVHGADRPHVSCGTPQSAIYALDGKLEAFRRAVAAGEDFQGDVHIEPQHGTNLTHRTLEDVGQLLNSHEEVAGLGNAYLDEYKQAHHEAKAQAKA